MRAPRLILSGLALAALAGGCRGGAVSDRPVAVATTTQLADMVRHVAGQRMDVRAILTPNADPHGYEPRPSDAAAIGRATVVFKSGGDLDGWLDGLIESAGGAARVGSLIGSVHTIRTKGGEVDPHWWQDPRNARLAVRTIRDALIAADPDGRAGYERGAARYTRRLRGLDAAIERCVRRVPAAKRKVVTTHDALGYFAERYGVKIVGSVIPSLSTQAQPSAKDVGRLVEQIRTEGVEAVFPESAISQRLESAISREAGASVGRPLYADSLGPAGTPAETYLGAMRWNADALVEGMSGGRVSCGR